MAKKLPFETIEQFDLEAEMKARDAMDATPDLAHPIITDSPAEEMAPEHPAVTHMRRLHQAMTGKPEPSVVSEKSTPTYADVEERRQQEIKERRDGQTGDEQAPIKKVDPPRILKGEPAEVNNQWLAEKNRRNRSAAPLVGRAAIRANKVAQANASRARARKGHLKGQW